MDQTEETVQGQYAPYRKKNLPKGYTPYRGNGEYYDGEYQFDIYDNDDYIKKSRFDRFRSWFGDMGGDFKQQLCVIKTVA